MSGSLKKAIMHHVKLRNIFLSNRLDENIINFNKQRNYCVSLKKAMIEYYGNLDTNTLCDN